MIKLWFVQSASTGGWRAAGITILSVLSALPLLSTLCLSGSLCWSKKKLTKITPAQQKNTSRIGTCTHYWHVIVRPDGRQPICGKQERAGEHYACMQEILSSSFLFTYKLLVPVNRVKSRQLTSSLLRGGACCTWCQTPAVQMKQPTHFTWHSSLRKKKCNQSTLWDILIIGKHDKSVPYVGPLCKKYAVPSRVPLQ